MNRRLTVIFCTIGFFVVAASAAETSGPIADLSGTLKEGEPVAIAEASGVMTAGRMAQLSHDSIVVKTSEGERRVQFTDISEVAVQRRSTGRGALIGTLAGVIVGELSSECRGDNKGEAHAECGEAAAMYGLLGTGAGALTGAFISHTVVVYRAPNAKVRVSPTVWDNKAAGVRVRW